MFQARQDHSQAMPNECIICGGEFKGRRGQEVCNAPHCLKLAGLPTKERRQPRPPGEYSHNQ